MNCNYEPIVLCFGEPGDYEIEVAGQPVNLTPGDIISIINGANKDFTVLKNELTYSDENTEHRTVVISSSKVEQFKVSFNMKRI